MLHVMALLSHIKKQNWKDIWYFIKAYECVEDVWLCPICLGFVWCVFVCLGYLFCIFCCQNVIHACTNLVIHIWQRLMYALIRAATLMSPSVCIWSFDSVGIPAVLLLLQHPDSCCPSPFRYQEVVDDSLSTGSEVTDLAETRRRRLERKDRLSKSKLSSKLDEIGKTTLANAQRHLETEDKVSRRKQNVRGSRWSMLLSRLL